MVKKDTFSSNINNLGELQLNLGSEPGVAATFDQAKKLCPLRQIDGKETGASNAFST